MNRGRAVIAMIALLCISVGSAWVYPPAGLIVPGALIWIDLAIGTARSK